MSGEANGLHTKINGDLTVKLNDDSLTVDGSQMLKL